MEVPYKLGLWLGQDLGTLPKVFLMLFQSKSEFHICSLGRPLMPTFAIWIIEMKF